MSLIIKGTDPDLSVPSTTIRVSFTDLIKLSSDPTPEPFQLKRKN